MRMLAAAVAVIALLCSACGRAESQSIISKERLVVGVRPDLPGLSQQLADGTFQGYEVDVARYLTGRLGAKVQFVPVSPSQREPMLRSGKVDLIVAAFSITQERKTRVSFAGPYSISHQDILVRYAEPEIRNVRDLAGRRICAVDGTNSAQNVITGAQVAATAVPAKSYGDCVNMMLNGTVDAISADDAILAGIVSQKRGTLRILNAPFNDQRSGVGIRKGDLDGCEALNQAITDMYQDGTANTLMAKWFGGSGLNLSSIHVPQFEGCE
jgi:glutamate transport system substrate-binding protein